MKRLIALIMCMLLALSAFAACGGDSDSKDDSKADSKTGSKTESKAEASDEISDGEPTNSAIETLPPNMGTSSEDEPSQDVAVSEDGPSEEEPSEDEPSVDESAEEKYTTYANDYVSFAYPGSWTESEENGVVTIISEDSIYNITVVAEPASDTYATMDTDGFVETLQPMFESMGLTITDPWVDQMVNANDEDVTVIGYVAEYSGVEMYQTIMVVTSGDTCQVITLTEVQDGGDLAQNIFDSIEVLK